MLSDEVSVQLGLCITDANPDEQGTDFLALGRQVGEELRKEGIEVIYNPESEEFTFFKPDKFED